MVSKVHSEYPQIKIIVLTTFYDEKNISHAIAGGACGYLLKDSGKDAILNAVSQALQGRSVLDSKVMEKLNSMLAAGALDAEKKAAGNNDGNLSSKESGTHSGSGVAGSFHGSDAIDLDDYGMTDREKEICRLIAEGCTNSQIASILFISEGTVKNYVSTIYDKLGEHDRTKVVLLLTRSKS